MVKVAEYGTELERTIRTNGIRNRGLRDHKIDHTPGAWGLLLISIMLAE